jgi:hypothetical protein
MQRSARHLVGVPSGQEVTRQGRLPQHATIAGAQGDTGMAEGIECIAGLPRDTNRTLQRGFAGNR